MGQENTKCYLLKELKVYGSYHFFHASLNPLLTHLESMIFVFLVSNFKWEVAMFVLTVDEVRIVIITRGLLE